MKPRIIIRHFGNMEASFWMKTAEFKRLTNLNVDVDRVAIGRVDEENAVTVYTGGIVLGYKPYSYGNKTI